MKYGLGPDARFEPNTNSSRTDAAKRFNTLVDRAGLPRITLHGVRHSYATIALRSGVHPKIVSSRVGHSSVAFTLQTYTEDIPDLDRQAAEDISGLFLPRSDRVPDGD